MTEPTIIQEPATNEHHRARWWRINTVKLSVTALSERTGYSTDSIYRFERGYTSEGLPHPAEAWRRYRMTCAAVANKGEGFDWA